jgi:L-alanine-DL-glutamate epimerase-like enolase superfamily enzyme
MKITEVTTHLLTAQWAADPSFPQALFATALIHIRTDSGLEGLGEATLGYFTPESVPPLVDFFRPLLIGQDPTDVIRLNRVMFENAVWWARTGAGRSVISGIEIALWDLKGKALGVPVYQLLGGTARTTVPVYASGGPSLWPIDENIRKIAHYAGLGYRAAKISTNFYKLPPPSTEHGVQRLEEIDLPFAESVELMVKNVELLRSEFGSGFDLAIDGHQGGVPNPISVSEAVEIANALAPYRLRFYEEPLAYTDIEGYWELRTRSRIPIAAGESLSGLDQFHLLIAQKGVHLVQPDLGFVGGIQESVRILHHAQAYNIGAAIHTGASFGPGLAASWHLAVAMQSVEWLETVVAAHSIHQDFLGEEFHVADGIVGLPTQPGLGIQFGAELLKKYQFIPGSGERT